MMMKKPNMTAPIFKAIFGADWDNLPEVMKQHYAARADSNDLIIAEGLMTVESSPMIRALKPLFHFMGTLVPYEGVDIPVTVHYRARPDSDAFELDRIFHFPGRAPYRYRSTMYPVEGRQVAEVMKFGLCWRTFFSWRDGKVRMAHRGYGFRIFGRIIPFPIDFLFGWVYAEETPINDHEFSMMMEIIHPWTGKQYGYSGRFKIIQRRDS
ncbi:MAG: DUF4166 domain-containing protein [Alphaproteobacteria bacterium]|nr:DUF4166 domain-containing protein [Alphaproteobacteria bacterium]